MFDFIYQASEQFCLRHVNEIIDIEASILADTLVDAQHNQHHGLFIIDNDFCLCWALKKA